MCFSLVIHEINSIILTWFRFYMASNTFMVELFLMPRYFKLHLPDLLYRIRTPASGVVAGQELVGDPLPAAVELVLLSYSAPLMAVPAHSFLPSRYLAWNGDTTMTSSAVVSPSSHQPAEECCLASMFRRYREQILERHCSTSAGNSIISCQLCKKRENFYSDMTKQMQKYHVGYEEVAQSLLFLGGDVECLLGLLQPCFVDSSPHRSHWNLPEIVTVMTCFTQMSRMRKILSLDCPPHRSHWNLLERVTVTT